MSPFTSSIEMACEEYSPWSWRQMGVAMASQGDRCRGNCFEKRIKSESELDGDERQTKAVDRQSLIAAISTTKILRDSLVMAIVGDEEKR